jgi:hypothetical protein
MAGLPDHVSTMRTSRGQWADVSFLRTFCGGYTMCIGTRLWLWSSSPLFFVQVRTLGFLFRCSFSFLVLSVSVFKNMNKNFLSSES